MLLLMKNLHMIRRQLIWTLCYMWHAWKSIVKGERVHQPFSVGGRPIPNTPMVGVVWQACRPNCPLLAKGPQTIGWPGQSLWHGEIKEKLKLPECDGAVRVERGSYNRAMELRGDNWWLHNGVGKERELRDGRSIRGGDLGIFKEARATNIRTTLVEFFRVGPNLEPIPS